MLFLVTHFFPTVGNTDSGVLHMRNKQYPNTIKKIYLTLHFSGNRKYQLAFFRNWTGQPSIGFAIKLYHCSIKKLLAYPSSRIIGHPAFKWHFPMSRVKKKTCFGFQLCNIMEMNTRFAYFIIQKKTDDV